MCAAAIKAALVEENRQCCKPPLDVKEVERIAASVSQYPPDTNLARMPLLPDAALHGIAGEITQLATADSEADPAAVLISVLVRAGATIGTGPYFVVGETRHHARLYAVKVGATSRARKDAL